MQYEWLADRATSMKEEMTMILIDPKGLMWGRRLRKLSLKARLYYPLMLSITNFYARVELDYDAILAQLSTFRDQDLTPANLASWFEEYKEANLVFLYSRAVGDPVFWVQFDTPVEMRRQFPSTEDNRSPEPPEPEYTDWLKAIHGDKWKDYHMTYYQQSISEKRAEAGRKGGVASAESKAKQNQANVNKAQPIKHGEGIGEQDGDVVGRGAEEVGGANSIYLVNLTNQQEKEDSVGSASKSVAANPSASGTKQAEQAHATSVSPDGKGTSYCSFCRVPGCDGDCDSAWALNIATMLDSLLGGTWPNGRPFIRKDETAEELADTCKKYPLYDWDKLHRWCEEATPIIPLLRRKPKGYAETLLLWAYGNPFDTFWPERTKNMKAFVTHVQKGAILDQFEEALKKPETWMRRYYLTRDSNGEGELLWPENLSAYMGMPDGMLQTIMLKYPPSALQFVGFTKCPVCEEAPVNCSCDFACPVCKKRFIGLTAIQVHIEAEHGKVLSEQAAEQESC
jgi:hypothetical protein